MGWRESAEQAVVEALDIIDRREGDIHAWAWLDREGALAAAARLDAGGRRGRLHGLTVGVKDLIDVEGMPTRCNSPIHADNFPERDAGVVRRLREAGAVVLGKTVTTEFAYKVPGPTRNPHGLSCTPGGSSSGSAAAVACGMVPLALGTQTSGSVIRPAAFCGVLGYKPAYGWCPTDGLKFLAPALDTVGLLAASFDVLVAAAEVMAARTLRLPAPPRRVVLVRHPNEGMAEPQALARLHDFARLLRSAGAAVRETGLPPEFAEADKRHGEVMAFGAAQAFQPEWTRHRDRLSPEMRELIEEGHRIEPQQVEEVFRLVRAAQGQLRDLVGDDETILTLPAPGEAPAGLGSTGNAAFNRLWTLLRLPSITIPAGRGRRGLPLGIQIVSPRTESWESEAILLAAARDAAAIGAAAGLQP